MSQALEQLRGPHASSIIDYTSYVERSSRGFVGREWLFQAVNNWLADPLGTRTLLIAGDPGSGKTAIAAMLTNFAKGKATPPASCPRLSKGFVSALHFCWRRDHRWCDPTVLAESLSAQLANRYPGFNQELIRRNSDRTVINASQNITNLQSGASATNVQISVLQIGAVDERVAFGRLVREPLEALLVKESLKILFLVDALDEAKPCDREVGITELLLTMAALPASVRFIFTSSDDTHVLNRLDKDQTTTVWLTRGDGLQNSMSDVSSLAAHRVEQPALKAKLAGGLTTKDLVDALEQVSKGNFLFVVYLLHMLEDQPEPITESTITRFPDGLDEIYRRLLEPIVGGSDDFQAFFGPVLGVICAAQEPLTQLQIADFADQQEDDVARTIAKLRPIVEITDKESVEHRRCSLYHSSIGDFLRDRDRAGEFWCNPLRYNERILKFYKNQSWPGKRGEAWDRYGLLYVVRHLQIAISLTRRPADKDTLAHDLYDLVLNPQYAQALQDSPERLTAKLEDPSEILPVLAQHALQNLMSTGEASAATLVGRARLVQKTVVQFDEHGIECAVATVLIADDPYNDLYASQLRTAFQLALDRKDWVRAVLCVRAYRTRDGGEIDLAEVFEQVDRGQFKVPVWRCSPTRPLSRWEPVLRHYLSWEAAEQGKEQEVRQLLSQREGPDRRSDGFARVLAARAAWTLSCRTANRDACQLLREWNWTEAIPVLERFRSSPGSGVPEPDVLRGHVGTLFEELRKLVYADSTQWFVDLTDHTYRTLWCHAEAILARQANEPWFPAMLRDLIRLVLYEPRKNHRDYALGTLGKVTACIRDAETARHSLRIILSALIEYRDPEMSFDLPLLLVGEMQRRNMSGGTMTDRLDRCRQTLDGWGTGLGLRLVEASLWLHQGRTIDAVKALREAITLMPGTSPHAVGHLIKIMMLLHGIRLSAPSTHLPELEPTEQVLAAARLRAMMIGDRRSRKFHTSLVEQVRNWCDTGAFGVEQVRLALTECEISNLPTLLDFALTSWGGQRISDWEQQLSELLPLAISVTSSCEAMLSRVLLPVLPQFSEEELRALTEATALNDELHRLWRSEYLAGPYDSSAGQPGVSGAEPGNGASGGAGCPTVGTSEAIAEILINLGSAREAAGSIEEASAAYACAAELLHGSRESQCLAEVTERQAQVERLQGHLQHASELFQRSWELMPEAADPGRRASIWFLLGETARESNENTIAWHFFDQALELADRDTMRHLVALCQNRIGVLALAEGKPEEARKRFELSQLDFERAHDVASDAVSQLNLSGVAQRLGNLDEAYKRARESLIILRILNGPGQLLAAAFQRMGSVLERLQRNSEAELCFARAADILSKTGPLDDGRFKLPDGREIVTPMISSTSSFQYTTAEGLQAVEIPMNGGMAVTLILPDPGKLQAVISALSGEGFERLLDSMTPRQMTLSLPKFRVESSLDPTTDDWITAETPEPDSSLAVPNVLFQARPLIPDPDIASMAAVLAPETDSAPNAARLLPLKLVLDHPFVLLVRHRETGLALFTGIVSDPSARKPE